MQLKSHLSDANLCQTPDYWQGLQMLAELLSCHEIRDADRWFIQHVDIAHKHWQGLCWLWFFVTAWPICNQYVVRTDMDFTNLVLHPNGVLPNVMLDRIIGEIQTYKIVSMKYQCEFLKSRWPSIKWLDDQQVFWQQTIGLNPNLADVLLIMRKQTIDCTRHGILGRDPMANLQWFIAQEILYYCAQQIGLDTQTTNKICEQISQGIV